MTGESHQASVKSELLPIVRKMELAKDEWLATLQTSGETNYDALKRLAELRSCLYQKPATGPVDALVQLGCILSLASYSFALLDYAAENPDEVGDLPAAFKQVSGTVAEILAAVDALRLHLEADAGISMKELGIFQNEGCTVQ